MIDTVEIVVIGGGVIGLAIARRLALDGREVLLVEREAGIGRGISSRSSEVIHAGIYYPSGTLKASLCVEGSGMLYDYCATRGIDHRRVGKLIVATRDEDLPMLAQLERRARDNGVGNLAWLDARAVSIEEPQLSAVAALKSPSTGIVDAAGFMLSLLGEAETAGAMVAFRTDVASLSHDSAGVDVVFEDPRTPAVRARHVVNAAGLDALRLAGQSGHRGAGAFAKGSYFALRGVSPFSHLIYPLPEPGGLGIHLTLDLAGGARFGPDVEWVEIPSYDVDPARAAHFYPAIRRYWPGLPDDALLPAYAGIRPKIGRSESDFSIVRTGRSIHLLGIESPGLTASLAISRHVARLIDAR